jgi:hypothetical protein
MFLQSMRGSILTKGVFVTQLSSKGISVWRIVWFYFFFFFVVKGPAAEATDAQPSDEGDNFFPIFPCNEHRWNEIDRVELKYWGGKPVPVPLCPPQIPHGPTDPGAEPGPPR